jgi:hypothetical protein
MTSTSIKSSPFAISLHFTTKPKAIPKPSIFLGNMSLQSLNMDSIEEFIVSNKAKVDLVWHFFIYAPLILRPQFLQHFTSSKAVKYSKLPYIPLLVHIILGVVIVGRYQFRAVSSDVATGVTNVIVSWRLSKYEGRGNPRLVRVGFQIMALMVLFPTLMCYRTASPIWYHSLAKMHNAFIYVRWLMMVGPKIDLYDGFHELYTISVFFGGILGIWEARFPWDGILGVPLALVLHVVLVIVERWTSSLITPE